MENITIEQFIECMKKLSDMGGEYTFQGTVDEKLVTLKGLGTYNKFFIVNSTKQGGSRDLTVDEWIHELRRGVTSH